MKLDYLVLTVSADLHPMYPQIPWDKESTTILNFVIYDIFFWGDILRGREISCFSSYICPLIIA